MQVRWDLVAIAVVYALGTSIGLGVYQARKKLGQTGDSFLYANKSLSPLVGGAAVALAAIGAVHTTGLMESGASAGLVTLWLCVTAGASMAWEGAFFVPYFRKMNANTIPEIMNRLFDFRCRTLASIVGILAAFVPLTVETQGGALVLTALTGLEVHRALILFTVLGLAYVMLTGMWQVAYLDLINVIVTYITTIIAFVIITMKIPGGWAAVEDFYISKGAMDALRFWPKDPGLLFGLALSLVIVVFCFNPQDQGKMQYYLCAQDVAGARRMGWIALLLNTPFGFFTTLIGLAAAALPQFSVHGPKMAGVFLTVEWLPSIVAGLLLASFEVLVLSTWARFTMGISQVLLNDVYFPLSKNPNKDKIVPMLSRVWITVPGILAVIPAYSMPSILLSAMFGFALGIPVFVALAIGLYWKRNASAAFWTILLGALTAFVWEFTPLGASLGLPPWFGTPWATVVVALVLGIGLTAVLPGEKGFARTQQSAASAQTTG